MPTIGLLGCGRIGRMHAANLAAHPKATLAWAQDVHEPSARAVVDAFGARLAREVDDVLADPTLDAVLIASSTDTHVDLITRAAKAGKAILCEKPIDLSMARVLACRDAIAPFAPRVQLGFNRRFDPSFAALERGVREGAIGDLRQVQITSRDPGLPPRGYLEAAGGLLRDMTIHDLDLARWILGEDVTEIVAFADVLIDPMVAEVGDHDAAMVLLRTASGKQASITNCREASYGYDQRIEALGATGMLKAENHRPTSLERWDAAGTATQDPIKHFFIERYREAYVAEIDRFVETIEAGGDFDPGFEDGVEALALADAAYESIATGRVVRRG